MKPIAIDLFAGAGGTTEGLVQAGCDVRLAIEYDQRSVATYKANFPKVAIVPELIEAYTPERIRHEARLNEFHLDILAACPPCQGFSTLGKCDATDERNDYVAMVGALTVALKPWALILENVPGMAKDERCEALKTLLRGDGYGVNAWTIDAVEFCVPQHRRRFILIAVRNLLDDEVVDPRKTYACGRWSPHPHTVREVLREVGEPARIDPLHSARALPPDILKRVRKIPHDGGSRTALPDELQLSCHKRLGGRRNAGSSYGRMSWDEPAPTMTTRCTTPACGRFLHPTDDRPITLREAAAFQTFSPTRAWEGGPDSVARQIGNAVPPRLSRVLTTRTLKLAAVAQSRARSR